MIFHGYGEFPAMANGGYPGRLLNRVTIFFIPSDVAGRGDGIGLLIEALVQRAKFDAESKREPDIHYRTDGIAPRLCRNFLTTPPSQQAGERHAGLNSQRRCVARMRSMLPPAEDRPLRFVRKRMKGTFHVVGKYMNSFCILRNM